MEFWQSAVLILHKSHHWVCGGGRWWAAVLLSVKYLDRAESKTYILNSMRKRNSPVFMEYPLTFSQRKPQMATTENIFPHICVTRVEVKNVFTRGFLRCTLLHCETFSEAESGQLPPTNRASSRSTRPTPHAPSQIDAARLSVFVTALGYQTEMLLSITQQRRTQFD